MRGRTGKEYVKTLPHSCSRSSHRTNMQHTHNQSLLAYSQEDSATIEHCPSQPAFAPENLLRLLRPGCAQTNDTSRVDTLTRTLSAAVINHPAHAGGWYARSASAPPATRIETRTTSIDIESTRAFEEWRALLGLEPPIDRVGRHEALNDVSGRQLKVFRTSPCPPRRRNCPHASDDDDECA